MKYFLILVLLTLILTACMGGASGPRGNCNYNGEICVSIQVEEPVVYGEPVSVTIIVTSTINIDDLGISLNFSPYGRVAVEDASSPEQGEEISRDQYGIVWLADLTDGQTLSFGSVLILPAGDYNFDLIASASTPQVQRATDMVYLVQYNQRVELYYSGTPAPTSPPLGTIDPAILPTLHALQTQTIYPTNTVVLDQFDFQFSGTPSPYPPPPYP